MMDRYYALLGLQRGATLSQVNRAYRSLVTELHPDRFPHDEDRRRDAEEKLKAINHARDCLRQFHERAGIRPPREAATQTARAQSRSTHAYRDSYRDARHHYQQAAGDRADADRRAAERRRAQQDARQRYQQQVAREQARREAAYARERARREAADARERQQARNAETYTYRAYAPPREPAAPPHAYSRHAARTQQRAYTRPHFRDRSGEDLSYQNLAEKDFSNNNLSGANLSGANLSDAFLHQANLSGANLSGANLFRANLLQANLQNADLRGANLIGADLSGADLRGANFTGANVGSPERVLVKLVGADLTGTILPNGKVCGT